MKALAWSLKPLRSAGQPRGIVVHHRRADRPWPGLVGNMSVQVVVKCQCWLLAGPRQEGKSTLLRLPSTRSWAEPSPARNSALNEGGWGGKVRMVRVNDLP